MCSFQILCSFIAQMIITPQTLTPLCYFPHQKPPVHNISPRMMGRCLWFYSYLSYKRTSYLESAHKVTQESPTLMQKKNNKMGIALQLDIYPQTSIDIICGIFRMSLEPSDSILSNFLLDSYGRRVSCRQCGCDAYLFNSDLSNYAPDGKK